MGRCSVALILVLGVFLLMCGVVLGAISLFKHSSEINGDSVIPDLIYVFSVFEGKDWVLISLGVGVTIAGVFCFIIGFLLGCARHSNRNQLSEL